MDILFRRNSNTFRCVSYFAVRKREVKQIMSVLKRSSIKKWLIGSHERKSPLSLAVYYSVLIGIGFIYVYPILYMLVNSFMSPADLADPSISWIPSEPFFGNFKRHLPRLIFGKVF